MIVSFGNLTSKMLIPLLIPLIYFVRHIVLENLTNKEYENSKGCIFINTFIASLSNSINIVLLFIEIELSKSKRKKTNNNLFDNQLLIERNKIKKKKAKKKILLLILISIFNYFNLQGYDFIKIYKPYNYQPYFFYSISITVFFLSTAFFTYLIFGIKFYRHQKISMIISPLLSILMFILFIQKLGIDPMSILYLIICLLVRNLRYILIVFGKLFMEKYYVTQIKLLSFFGGVGLLLTLISNLVSFFIESSDFENGKELNNKKLLNIIDYWKYMNKIMFLLTIVLWFFENYIAWFCISAFGPNHYIIFTNISSIIVIYKELIFDKNNNLFAEKIFSFFALIGMIICGLIFNEIIIIKIWNLDKYTAIEIDKRQREEINTIKLNNNDESIDNDDETRNSERSSETSTIRRDSSL